MTKAQLIKALEPYDDNSQIGIEIEGLASWFYIDALRKDDLNRLYVYCEDAPEYEDIQSLCEHTLDFGKSLPEEWIEALTEVADLKLPINYQRDEE